MSPSRHTAWEAALDVIRRLRDAGHVAVLAGGCVRDRLLGVEPKDYDVATDAPPDTVAGVFPRARSVGAQFGVMLVRKFGHDVEVATFRSDGTYSDGRRPDEVSFATAKQDAHRRDFTINGLFYDPLTDRLIDYVGGQADLTAGTLRTIGDAEQRFAEDHLRMLRAVRFAARLGFTIDADTFEAIRRHAHQLAGISAERVWMELEAILTASSRARGWRLICDTGLRRFLCPAWSVDPREDDRVHARLCGLADEPLPAELVMAAVLCDRGPRDARRIGRALRLSNRLTESIVWLLQSLAAVGKPQSLELADLKLLLAHPCWRVLLALLRANLTGADADLAVFNEIAARAADIPEELVAPPPLVDGDDLCGIGLTPGPRLGAILEKLYREQLNERILDRDAAMTLARNLATGDRR